MNNKNRKMFRNQTKAQRVFYGLTKTSWNAVAKAPSGGYDFFVEYDIDQQFKCLDCKTSTLQNEYYMVHDAIWLKANPDRKGMLCIGCLETRLGRTLNPSDFTAAPINEDREWGRSSRLRNRQGYE